jgi:hypothetical protein
VRQAKLEAGDRQIVIACVGQDDEAFYGYPGDVVYPKSDWSLRTLGPRTPIGEYAELEHQAFQRAWAARPQ